MRTSEIADIVSKMSSRGAAGKEGSLLFHEPVNGFISLSFQIISSLTFYCDDNQMQILSVAYGARVLANVLHM